MAPERTEALRAPSLARIPWLVHGFSTRRGGVSKAYGGGALNLGVTKEDTRANVERNRELFLEAIGAAALPTLRQRQAKGRATRSAVWPLVHMRQVHSSIVHPVERAPEQPLAGDGLITRTPGIVLSVRTADCLPVLLVDTEQRAVGIFHAGWKGTLRRIVEKGVGEMRRNFGSDPAKLEAAIGPGIHRCCYEVSDDFREKFAAQFAYAEALFEDVFDSDPVRKKYPLLFMNQRAPGHGEPPSTVHLDLVEANRRQLLDAGLRKANIWASEMCTSCRTDLFFSHRKERGVTGRMMTAIAIKN